MATDSYKKYKTFDQLLADVLLDFRNFSLENMIDPQDLVRVVKRVNRDLGLRLHTTKQTILSIEHFKCQLPEDFFVMNFGTMTLSGCERITRPTGTHITQVPYIPSYKEIPATIDTCTEGQICPTSPILEDCHSCGKCTSCYDLTHGTNYNSLVPLGDPCIKPRLFTNCKGDVMELIQIVSTELRLWKAFYPVSLVNLAPDDDHHLGVYNSRCRSPFEIWFKNGFVYSNQRTATLYMNYEGALEDEDGNILVLSREDVCEYYEYALKERILENLFINGEDVATRLQLIQGKLRKARIEAKNVVNTPDFKEIRDTWKTNREAFNRRYVDMFLASGWLNYPFNSYVDGRRIA